MINQTTSQTSIPEVALEPSLPICDPHHHLWDYPSSRYLVDELLDDLSGGHNIISTVYVECRHGWRDSGPESMRPIGETEYVERIVAAANEVQNSPRLAAGIVAFADLTLGKAAQPVLEAHLQASERVRGIRYMSAWDAHERIHNAQTNPQQNLFQDPEFNAGLACLLPLGLTFDAWIYHPQLPELIELARNNAEQTIVLNHIGGPLGIGPYAGKRDDIFAEWRDNMATLAKCDNVFVKLGGLTMSLSGFGWHKSDTPPTADVLATAMGPYYRTCIDYFGADRCMFESNWPVDKVSCSYTTLWNAFKTLSSDYSDEERKALFHDTAARIYRL